MSQEKVNIVFGLHPILEAIAAGKKIDKIVARKGLNGAQFSELQEACKKNDIRIQYASSDVLDRITTNVHQGVVAFMSGVEYIQLHQIAQKVIESGREAFIILLDGVTDVRNFGAIARTAHCAGAQALIVSTKKSAPVNGESLKASAGALNHIPICLTQNSFFAVKTLKEAGFQIVCATEHSAKVYTEVDFKKPTLLIVGSEGKGISSQLLKLADERALIPMVGEIESLNVSVATAIFTYEAVRQRNV